MNVIHLTSPFLYALFVYCIQDWKKVHAPWFHPVRKIYNMFMSIWSAYMLYIITLATYNDGKFTDWCTPYQSYTGVNMFLYSKYVEWLDTLFLVLSGKKISRLQYIHHMSTVVLTYTNVNTPSLFIFMGSNCFVHWIMYWYFAFPRGMLRPYRKWITGSQIVQHALCLYTIGYHRHVITCYRPIGLDIGLGAYAVYLFMFLNFYLKVY